MESVAHIGFCGAPAAEKQQPDPSPWSPPRSRYATAELSKRWAGSPAFFFFFGLGSPPEQTLRTRREKEERGRRPVALLAFFREGASANHRACPHEQKKSLDNINSRLQLVMRSGKVALGYKQTLKNLRSGKGASSSFGLH